MCGAQFCVVEFTEENGSLGLVPTNWISDGCTYWPPFHDAKNDRLAKKIVVPDIGWKRYPIKQRATAGT